jgi:hypothetical protein
MQKCLLKSLACCSLITGNPSAVTGPGFLTEQMKTFLSTRTLNYTNMRLPLESDTPEAHIRLVDARLFHPNLDYANVDFRCNPLEQGHWRAFGCKELPSYYKWLNETGAKQAVLLTKYLHLGWGRLANTMTQFEPFTKYPRLRFWPLSK